MRRLFSALFCLVMLFLMVPTAMAGTTGTQVLSALGQLPQVKIGVADQPVADITITESAAGSVDETRNYSEWEKDHTIGSVETNEMTQLVLRAPAGVTFSNVPEVKVTEGDLKIDVGNIKIDTTAAGEGLLYIPVKSASTEPSTLKISNIRLTIDRTVPVGPVVLKLQGDALNETLDATGRDNLFPGAKTVAEIAVADCVTPAPAPVKSTAVFKIGDYSYSTDGLRQTMDVTPFVENNHAFIPLRYAVRALGIAENNILYRGGKVIVFQGGKIIQFEPGDKELAINGTVVNVDVAPVSMNGRVMLPLDCLGLVLNVDTNWDRTTNIITIQKIFGQ